MRGESELRSSALAAWLIPRLYRFFKCHRRWRLGRVLVALALRLEGGPMFSRTARLILSRHHGITVGSYSYGAMFRVGTFPANVEIGRYVSIGYDARAYTENHPLTSLSTHPFFYDARCGYVRDNDAHHPAICLRIEHDAWIGNHSVILPGCKRIGIGAVIGAGAIVTKDVPDYAIVVGNPARVIRYRFDEQTRAKLVASRWWESSVDNLASSGETILSSADLHNIDIWPQSVERPTHGAVDRVGQ